MKNTKKDLQNINLENIPEPTRFFNKNDEVIYHGLNNVVILESLHDGKVYKVEADSIERDRWDNKSEPKREIRCISWESIFLKENKNQTNKIFSNRQNIFVKFRLLNQDIQSILLHKLYSHGIDLNPDYQRDSVWSLYDKQKLIESIFNGVEIGKFALLHRSVGHNTNKCYEVIDGKQRITALSEFYCDRFTYNGVKYSDLSIEDRNYFLFFPIQVMLGEKNEFTKKEIYQYFLLANNGGVKVTENHLKKVEQLMLNEK